MTLDELKTFREQVFSMGVDGPWCENVGMLKKWVEGFEECQDRVLSMVDRMIENEEAQREE